MKKILALLLALTLVFALAACGGGGTTIVRIESPADLEADGIRIGVQMGSTGHVFAEANFPDADVMAFASNGDVVLALLGGDVDAVIMDNSPAQAFVAHNEGRLRQLDEVLTEEFYGISFQLGSPYVALFNAAIDELRASGMLDQLVNYWINEDPDAAPYVSPPGTSHPNGTLVMGTSADFEPFEFIGYDGEIIGLDPDIARAIGDILGYAIEIVDMDFGVIILSVQTGQVDFGMAGMTVNEERLEMVDFTQGYYLTGLTVIVRA